MQHTYRICAVVDGLLRKTQRNQVDIQSPVSKEAKVVEVDVISSFVLYKQEKQELDLAKCLTHQYFTTVTRQHDNSCPELDQHHSKLITLNLNMTAVSHHILCELNKLLANSIKIGLEDSKQHTASH